MLCGFVVSLVVTDIFGCQSCNDSGESLHILDNKMYLFTCKMLHSLVVTDVFGCQSRNDSGESCNDSGESLHFLDNKMCLFTCTTFFRSYDLRVNKTFLFLTLPSKTLMNLVI